MVSIDFNKIIILFLKVFLCAETLTTNGTAMNMAPAVPSGGTARNPITIRRTSCFYGKEVTGMKRNTNGDYVGHLIR